MLSNCARRVHSWVGAKSCWLSVRKWALLLSDGWSLRAGQFAGSVRRFGVCSLALSRGALSSLRRTTLWGQAYDLPPDGNHNKGCSRRKRDSQQSLNSFLKFLWLAPCGAKSVKLYVPHHGRSAKTGVEVNFDTQIWSKPMDIPTPHQTYDSRELVPLSAAQSAAGEDRTRVMHPQECKGLTVFAQADAFHADVSTAPCFTVQTRPKSSKASRRRPRKIAPLLRLPAARHIGLRKTEVDFDRASRLEEIALPLYRVPPQFLVDAQGVFRTVGRLAARLQIVDRREWLLFIRELNAAAEFYRANFNAHLPPGHRMWARIRRLPAYMSAVEGQSLGDEYSGPPARTPAQSSIACDRSAEDRHPESCDSYAGKSADRTVLPRMGVN